MRIIDVVSDMSHCTLHFSDPRITTSELARFLVLRTLGSVVVATRLHVAIMAAAWGLEHCLTTGVSVP